MAKISAIRIITTKKLSYYKENLFSHITYPLITKCLTKSWSLEPAALNRANFKWLAKSVQRYSKNCSVP